MSRFDNIRENKTTDNPQEPKHTTPDKTSTRQRFARNRSATSTSASAAAKPASGSQFRKTSEVIRRNVEAEKERASSDRSPYRFRLKKGESSQIIIVDSEPNFAVHEHVVKVGNQWQNITCINEYDTCPVCLTNDKPSYVVMMTCLTLAQNDKGEDVTYKNLLAVKSSQTDIFFRYLDQFGSLRGTVFEMKRGTADTSASIGEPMYIDRISEENFLEEFTLPEPKKNQKGEVYMETNYYTTPFNYEEIFPALTKLDICRKYGFSLPSGSSEVARRELVNADSVEDIPLDD